MLKFNKNIKIGDRMIGPDYPTYFIAEIGGNFDGSLDKAKRLIDAAKEAGADCAKFQTFKAESIVSEGGFSKMTLHGVHGSWGRTVSEVFKDVEFPLEWHQEIADYCKHVGIDFSTSPYFKEAIDACVDLKVPFIKIGSGEITWLEMLEYTASKGIPVMLATGDATMSEIDEAVRAIEKTGNKDLEPHDEYILLYHLSERRFVQRMSIVLFAEGPQLLPEYNDYCKNCAELNHNIEHFLEFVGFVEIKELSYKNKMSCAAYGKPLGYTFNYSEYYCFDYLPDHMYYVPFS